MKKIFPAILVLVVFALLLQNKLNGDKITTLQNDVVYLKGKIELHRQALVDLHSKELYVDDVVEKTINGEH